MASQPDGSSEILEAVALLVVDMQGSFLAPIANSEQLLVRCGLAIASARALGINVVFTEQVPEKLSHTDERLRALAPGSRVFPKDSFSALQAPGIREHLKKLGVYHLLVLGIEMPVCIYQTALHARDSDFDVTVLSDCVGGRRPDDCRDAIDSIARTDCHVLPGETVFYSMLGSSGHRHFRQYTDLVKQFGEMEKLTTPKPAEPSPQKRKPRNRGRGNEKDATPEKKDAPSRHKKKKAVKSPLRVAEAKQSSSETDSPSSVRDAAPTASKPARKRPSNRRGGRSRRSVPARKTRTPKSGGD